MLWSKRVALTLMVGMGVAGMSAANAAAAITPGWECIPKTAGKSVVSGGTGSTPSCTTGTTAVLAPTYVSAGIGDKPTAVFSGVNVQVASGSDSTSGPVNGRGNLVVGYAENPSNAPRTGANDLIVGDTPLGSAILGGEHNSIDSSQGGAIAGGHSLALSSPFNDVSVIGTQIFNP